MFLKCIASPADRYVFQTGEHSVRSS